ncbi:MAG: DUF4389 domain-containing protein [Gammaproteobacteria bacterium]|nr:DUF4389 domain-containing protein [Gammaproteobacteria bacterium]
MNSSSSPSGRPANGRPLEENLKAKTTWLRLVFMLVFVVLYGIAELVTAAVVVLQFLWVLFTGEPNAKLRAFGQSLATYTYQVFRYLTYNSERRPFPFDLDWPQGPAHPAEEPPPAAGAPEDPRPTEPDPYHDGTSDVPAGDSEPPRQDEPPRT